MKRVFLAAALLVCAAFAQAQQMPPGKWWRKPEIIRELQLTADQQQRLDNVFTEAANDLIDARGAVEKLQVAIRSELDRPQVRRQELRNIASQLSAARGRLFERELMMLVDMRAVLTDQQWTQMRTRLEQIQENRRLPKRPMDRRRQ